MAPEAVEAAARRPPGCLPVAANENAGCVAFTGKRLKQNAAVVFDSFSKA